MKEIKNCILLSTADWDAPYWTNKQHTTKHLAQRDIRVLYIESVGLRAPKLNSSIDLARIWRRLLRGLKGAHEVEKNIWILSPLVIPFKHHWTIIKKINRWWLNKSIQNFCKHKNFQNLNTILWTYHPYVLDYLNCKNYLSLVYHCVDDLSAVPGIDKDAFVTKEKELLTEANIVFTTSKKLYEKCSVINKNTYDFPNVVDWEHFSNSFNFLLDPYDLTNIERPRLVYAGVLTDLKVDFQLLIEVALEEPSWSIVLIGDEREGQINNQLSILREIKNVYFLGYKSYKELPRYLGRMDVGLLPSLINTYTDSMFPMKFYEYISCGLKVVSINLKFTETEDFLIPQFISVVKKEQFKDAIRHQLNIPKLTKTECSEFVRENTWERRLEKMLNLLKA